MEGLDRCLLSCCPKGAGGLGFKGMGCFNRAVLSKQWSRIINNRHLLSFQILKAKYFRNSSPEFAANYNGSCFLWRSLTIEKVIVDGGFLWRVGNGADINVWYDKWLDKPPSFAPARPPIIVDSRLWNVELINELMCSTDSSLISNINLASNLSTDKII